MILASFQIKSKLEIALFFYEVFLLANISIKLVLEMQFLTLSNAKI